MPSEFASAIADLRLSGDKLDQDFNAQRTKLLRLTQQLEKQATINVSVNVDARKAQTDLNRAMSSFAARGSLTIPVGIDTDKALDDLVALQGLIQGEPLTIPVTAAIDQALDEIGALEGLIETDPFTVSVSASIDAAIDEIGALEGLVASDALILPVTANVEPAIDEIGALEGLVASNALVVPVTANVEPVQQAISSVVANTMTQGQSGFGNAGEASGQAFADRFSQITFSALGTASIALGGFVATSLFRGFQRLTTIQDATASLTVALGDAAAAANVLDDVLDVVTGTPFNLDQFATAASNLISFGVEAEKVPTYLTAIGEAAATRGSRANEFAQRLANTFGQVSVQGRIMGDDILSLQATGVDALRILGNSFGETTVDIREMISQGAVPAGQALDILAEGIMNGSTGINGATVAFAGTMEGLRETLTGAIGGFRSSTARFGVAIIKPFEDALTTGFNSATDVVNKFNTEVGDALGAVADSDGFRTFTEFIGSIPDQIDPLIERLSGLGPALAPIGAAFGALGLGQLKTVLGPLGALVPPIGALSAAIVAFVATTPELREVVLPILGELGETAAELSAGLGVALGDALTELTPLLVQFVESIGDLSPTIKEVAGLTVALANGLVPILGTLADLLDGFPLQAVIAIGGAFAAWKVIGALGSGIDRLQGSLAGVSANLQLAEAGSEKFGSTFYRVANDVGVSGTRVMSATKALSAALNVAATAAAGFFSGMATQSEDATIQITGFLGAATSIGTAFATGGPVGGIVTSAAVVGGALTSMWVEAKQAAAEYEKEIDRIAREIVDDLTTVEIKMLDLKGITTDEDFGDLAVGIIGGEETRAEFEALGVSLDDFLNLAGDPARLQEFLSALERVEARAGEITSRQVNSLFERGDVDAFQKQGELYAQNFTTEFDRTLAQFEGEFDLSQLFGTAVDANGNIIGLDSSKLREAVGIVVDLNKAGLDTQAQIAADAAALAARLDVELGNIVRAAELTDDQIAGIRDTAGALGLETQDLVDILKESGPALAGIFDAVIPQTLINEGLDAFDILLMKPEALAKNFGFAVEVTEDGSVKIVEALGDVDDGLDGTGTSAAEMATAIDAAMKEAEAAADRFSQSLDAMLSKLDEVTNQQNYAAGFRDISEALNEVTNADELKEREGLIDDIAKQREGLIDLQSKLANEEADATIKVANLDLTIADADEKGAVQIAAALRRKRDEVLGEVDDIRDDINERIDDLNQLEARAATLAQTPISLRELLNDQAAERGISLEELLITAPTEESRAFFQSEVEGQIRQAAVIIQQAVDDNPLDAAIKMPSLIDGLIQGFIGSGLDAATAEQIVNSVLDPEQLAKDAVDSFEAAFTADVAKLGGVTQAILNGEDIDPSIDVNAVVTDVGEGIAALEERERLGLTIPGDIDLIAARDTLAAFESAYSSEEDFAIVIPIEGDLTAIIADLDALAAYALQLNSATLGQSPERRAGRNWLDSPDRNVGRGGINGPVPLAHGGILQFFKDGGITENHVAQISRNTARLWSEPETGGEGYIPLHPSKRPRSTRILTDIADMFGLDVMPRGLGIGGDGMDESSMARAVERGVKAGRMPSAAARARAHDQGGIKIDKIEVNGVRDPNRAARRVMRNLSDVAMGMTDWDWDEI